MGEGRAGSVARSRAVNLTLIVIYKGKVGRTWHTTGFIHVNIAVRRYFSSFGRTPSSGMKAAQSFIHEAPGLYVSNPSPQSSLLILGPRTSHWIETASLSPFCLWIFTLSRLQDCTVIKIIFSQKSVESKWLMSQCSGVEATNARIQQSAQDKSNMYSELKTWQ